MGIEQRGTVEKPKNKVLWRGGRTSDLRIFFETYRIIFLYRHDPKKFPKNFLGHISFIATSTPGENPLAHYAAPDQTHKPYRCPALAQYGLHR
jgi:hypothetical protein